MTNSIAFLATQSSEMTMSSLEIAKLTGKEHYNVLRDIRNMLEELDLKPLSFEGLVKMPSGQTSTTFNLPKHECMVLVTGYSIKLRSAVLRRWQELEDAQRAPVKPAYSLLTATVQERLVNEISLAFEAMELYKQVEARLAIGDYCTWISFCNANSHISWLDRRNNTAFKLSLTVAKLYRRDFGKKTEKVGVEGTDTTPQVVYPTDWLMKAVVEAAAEYGRSTKLEIYRPEIARVKAPLAESTVNAFHEVQQLTNTQH